MPGMERLPITRALLSVTDKSDLTRFAGFLVEGGAELVSTGGTMRAMAEAGLPITSVSQVTGFPEILGGRVKTLHPAIHAGVLADKDDPSHLETLREQGIAAFDLVCVNLYDFASAAAKGADLREAVEQIDIGGPTLLRAAAKNFHSMLVVPGTEFYQQVMDDLEDDFTVSLQLRQRMAAETFKRVSAYDTMIAEYLAKGQPS